jgi:hypothetical protein
MLIYKLKAVDQKRVFIIYLLVLDENEYENFLTKGSQLTVDENGYAPTDTLIAIHNCFLNSFSKCEGPLYTYFEDCEI